MERSASPAEDAAEPRVTGDRSGRRRSWRRAIAGIGVAAAAAGWTAVLGGVLAAAPPALAAGGTPSAQLLGDPPGPPAGLTATAGSSQVLLSWAPPASDGQSPVISYEIFEGTSPGGEGTSPVGTVSFAVTTYTVTSLTNGTPYYFEVEAVNDAAGAGPASNEASAVPGGQTITFGPLAAEPAGTTFSVSATASSGLAVVFSSGTPGVCTVTAAGSVTTVAPGTCTITAAQAGNSAFEPAPDVTRSFPAGQGPAARSPGTLVIILLAVVIVVVAVAAARLARRYRRARSHPPAGPEPQVRAEPDSGPPPSASVRVTGTGTTRTVRIEPAPGATTITTEENRP
jgi:hypothetical protein